MFTTLYDNNFWLTSLSVNDTAISYGYDNDGLLTGTRLGAVTTSRSNNSCPEPASTPSWPIVFFSLWRRWDIDFLKWFFIGKIYQDLRI